MADSMPIPVPPRTPTPPPDEPASPPLDPAFDADAPIAPNTLSPLPIERESMFSLDAGLRSPTTPGKSPSKDGFGPFNFQPAAMAKSPVIKSNIGQRRGHKYKHSSVSHQIFLEPPPRAPLALPNSLPIPTFAECRASMTKDQNIRFYWSICHMAIAGYTAWNAHGSAAIEALSHLIFYDSLGALLCVFVEVLSNFEVWGRSSVRHPFGLQRMEVIAGFALSVLLIFFGFDLISHNAKHALEGIGHEPHHPHTHERVSAGTVDLTAMLALVATLISAVGLQNHARIGKAMRFAAMENLPSLLSNPSHFLTLSCSATMLMLPLLSLHTYEWVDKVLSLSIALSMLFLGAHLGRNVGAMLLMSLPSKAADVAEVVQAIEAEPLVRNVEQAKFWQAHYGMGMANLRLRVVGTEESLLKLRERIGSIIRNRLSGGYGSGSSGQKWEVSVQFKVDIDSAISQSHGHGHFGSIPGWTSSLS
ncbi:cation efflux family-domain-containing protein [Exophiala viscosa]|uniref:cation efflux family-domain-containing protein n=1 Tax=Exophiala viscosa TaxID=2486360 RepID=UPI002197BC11|nr:cation efflux family-domain-containing protein [Exophiala viscosa]